MRRRRETKSGPVEQAVRHCYGVFLNVAVFSGVINILALTGSFYMLQVYDRVLPSRSIPTLVGLSLLMVGLYVSLGTLDFFRVRVMARVGLKIDNELRQHVFDAVQLLPLRSRQASDGLQPVRDLDSIRAFLSGMGPTAFFDMPWVPIYLAVVYLLHPILGLFALFGAFILVSLTLLTELKSSKPMQTAAKSGSRRLVFGEAARRNAEVIRAMGLGPQMHRRWAEINAQHLLDHLKAADTIGGVSAVSKIVRMLMQAGILGLGAYLVIGGEGSAGIIIAASIIMSRALAPIEAMIAHWRGFVSARQSYRRLVGLFRQISPEAQSTLDLPRPQKSLVVESLTVAPPGELRPVLQGVQFSLVAGDGLGIIGPSASGKSTLARALVGAWLPVPMGGSVRLDGAALDQWAPAALGPHIGYLPQDIELLEGTVAENIARFDSNATSEAIIHAARAAGVHEMIVHLVNGYQTEIGESGQVLSAGQRQLIGLARALYGDPFLVVLDEPNSNLDAIGDTALHEAIGSVRNRGGIIVVIAHRPSALAGVNKLLAIVNGRVQAFGPTEDVRKMMTAALVPQQPLTAAPPSPQPRPAPIPMIVTGRQWGIAS